jgi:hypothetical protein
MVTSACPRATRIFPPNCRHRLDRMRMLDGLCVSRTHSSAVSRGSASSCGNVFLFLFFLSNVIRVMARRGRAGLGFRKMLHQPIYRQRKKKEGKTERRKETAKAAALAGSDDPRVIAKIITFAEADFVVFFANQPVSRWDRILAFTACNLGAAACFTVCFFLFPVLSLRPRKFAVL